MKLDPDHCYAAIQAHDSRFDGVFYVGVSTTGVYCRPVCRVRTPGRDRCHYFNHAAQAESAGFRPCLRCRPELAPGHAPIDRGPQLADQAYARIRAGALNEGSLEELASSLELSSRQLRRILEQQFGVGPLALAQTQRLLLAKQLITETRLSMAEIAFAAGFGSVRRFNAAFAEHYRLNPLSMRRAAAEPPEPTADAGIRLRLAYRPPLAWATLAGFLASRGATGVEGLVDGAYLRCLRIGAQKGWVRIHQPRGKHWLQLQLSVELLPVLPRLLASLRHLLDLDAQPQIIAAHLSQDPLLQPLIEATPGLRVPGCVDGFELALRAVIGQQVSVAAATTVFARCVQRFGESLHTPFPELTHLPPQPEVLAAAPLESIASLGMPGKRASTIQALARAMVEGQLQLDAGADPAATRAALLALPGIGPWTADYVAMRALRQPDAFPQADLGLMRALGVSKGAQVLERAEGWRPWRAYAALHLWNALSAGG
ncbi:MAG: AlkA N-terminal domain-containing protein [Oceanococcaceae bacterium]